MLTEVTFKMIRNVAVLPQIAGYAANGPNPAPARSVSGMPSSRTPPVKGLQNFDPEEYFSAIKCDCIILFDEVILDRVMDEVRVMDQP